MEAITVRIPEDDLETLDSEADEHDATRSEYIRDLIEKGRDYDELAAERARLNRELAQVIEHRESSQEIVEYVEEEKTWREAPIWKRIRWWVLGKDG